MNNIPTGYKQTEVGVIPEDWEVAPLEEFTSFISYGFTNPMPTSESGVHMITAKDINCGKIQFDTARTTTEEAYRTLLTAKSRPKKGDLLLTKDGTLGRLALVDDRTVCINQSVAVLRPNAKAVPEFLKALLEAPAYQNKMLEDAGGSTIKHIYITIVNQMPLALPPTKAEQEAIANALSDADALIESLDQLIAKKRQIKQGAMQELLTGKKRLPGFRGEWDVKSFGEVFDYNSTATNSRSDLTDDGDTYYIHYGDIHTRFHSHLDFRKHSLPRIERSRCRNATPLKNGDWVMADASEDFDGIGKSIEICGLKEGTAAVAGLHTFLLREKSPTFVPGFKGHLGNLKSLHDQFLRVATGLKVYGVSKTALKDLLLPIPSQAEQTAIATILSDMDAEIAALETKLTKARLLKQGMMQELLTGRIRLVPTVSKVIPFPSKKVSGTTSTKSHNWQINEAVIIAVLAKYFGSEKYPLARKRCTKLTYLLHRHVEREAEGYLKKAAGPYNPATRYKGPEAIAQKNGYIRSHHNGTYSGFVSSTNISQAEAYFQQWYGTDAQVWLEQFRRKKTDELELLATVDMAMEDLRRAGKAAQLDTVKQVIHDHPEWEAKLQREIFSDINIARAIQICRELFA